MLNKKSKRKVSFLLILVILTTSLIQIDNIIQNKIINSRRDKEITNEDNYGYENIKISRISGKIHINNNWTATKAASLCTGQGTLADPYIIRDLIINVGGFGCGILIENTNEYFKIINCSISNSEEYPDAGIKLSYVENGILEGNNCSYNNRGIRIEDSSKITVSNNTFYESWFGIEIWTSNSITIIRNNCSKSYQAIHIYISSDCTLNENICKNSEFGIHIYLSSSISLLENIMENCGIVCDGSKTAVSSHNIDETNLVNGKPVRYYSSQIGVYVPSNTGQVIMANCSFSTVENQDIKNTTDAIEILYCSNITISGNNCSFNMRKGIFLDNSYNNTIQSNNCSYNGWIGIDLTSSEENLVFENNCTDNKHGIYLYGSDNNTVNHNTCSKNEDGLYLHYSDDNILDNNFCLENENGIVLSYAFQSILIGNRMKKSGVSCWGSIEIVTSYTIDISNLVNGKPIRYYANQTYIDVPQNAGQVILANCNFSTIDYLEIFNTNIAICMLYSSNNAIIENNCSYNSYIGIYLYYSNNNTISKNNCSYNFNAGIRLLYCENNTIKDNLCNFGGTGISDYNSENNRIIKNNCSKNDIGIYISYCNNTLISGNLMRDCGILLEGDQTQLSSYLIDTTNLVNNKPIYYYVNQSNIIVPQNAGQIIMVNCTSSIIKNVEIIGATIGITILFSSYINISENFCSENNFSIVESYSPYNLQFSGIYIHQSHDINVSKNICTKNFIGICAYSSENSLLFENNCSENIYGILVADYNSIIKRNNCTENSIGIVLSGIQNIIAENNFMNNDEGMRNGYSNGNKLYLNNFINDINYVQFEDTSNIWNTPSKATYNYNNYTYNNYLGNFWNNYIGSDIEGDGIGDSPHIIGSSEIDYYPLIEPIENYNITFIQTQKIYINGNQEWSDFKKLGGCTGQGTYADPYVIKEFEINGGGIGSCILIENTDVYFRIENCTVYNSGSERYIDAGIKLINVTNGILQENNFSNNNDGIFLYSSDNITIINNTINNNYDRGIALRYSNNNLITKNIVKYNHLENTYLHAGIAPSWCNNNIISENILAYNAHGIALSFCNYHNISENNVYNNLGYGVYIDGTIYEYSENNTICKNNIVNNNWNGITLHYCNNCIIYENNVENNYMGISLQYSNYNTFFLNNIISAYKNIAAYKSQNRWNSPDLITYIYNSEIYSSQLGNYWSNYSGSDSNGDGIGESYHTIKVREGVDDTDNYPLISQFSSYTRLTFETLIPFDGMHSNYTFKSPIFGSGSGNLTYSQISAELFHMTGISDLWNIWWDVNRFTRIVTDTGGDFLFVNGSHTPFWIFKDVNIGSTVLISVDGEGDHIFEVSDELFSPLPGYGILEAWKLTDLTVPGGIALYEKRTGILLNATFYYFGGIYNYTLTLTNTNAIEELPVIVDIGIPNLDKLLMERDPLTRTLFSRSTQEFIALYGEDIWDKLNTKYVLEFEIDLCNELETVLFGFTPKIRVRFEAWKSENDIHIKIIPQFIINKKSEEITFSGPFDILQKIKSTILNYPGVDFELNFGVLGALELKWNTITNDLTIEQWNVGIQCELILIGQYITFLASLVNPAVAKALDKIDELIENVFHRSILDLCTGELKLRLIFSVGSDAEGYFAKLDLIPIANLINIDLNLDEKPELIASVHGAFSLKWNKNGIGTAGKIEASIKIDIEYGPLKIKFFPKFELLSFDTMLWDLRNNGNMGINVNSISTFQPKVSNSIDTDLDGLSDYYEGILNTLINDSDTDDDNLSDYFEVLYGTNPRHNDSDSDGLNDFDEITKYYSDPIKQDTDLDKINDFDEINGTYDGIKTSPFLNDTDFDGILDGDESISINPINPGTNPNKYDTDGDGYSDGLEINKYLTDPLNPLDTPLDTDLDGMPDIDETEIGTNPTVDDFSQDTDLDTIPDIIEELVFMTNKTLQDSDLDGFNDIDEIINGTNPNNPNDYPGGNFMELDSDNDGLADIAEINLFYTNINLNDTDNDSFNDLEEVLMGSDPNDALSIPIFEYDNNFNDIEKLLPSGEPFIIIGYPIYYVLVIIFLGAIVLIIFKIKRLTKI